jgi:hypothetical protein
METLVDVDPPLPSSTPDELLAQPPVSRTLNSHVVAPTPWTSGLPLKLVSSTPFPLRPPILPDIWDVGPTEAPVHSTALLSPLPP